MKFPFDSGILRHILAFASLPAYLLVGGTGFAVEPGTGGSDNSRLYALTTQGIDGKSVDLKQYEGKVALVVNVASKCGFTPQYNGLQKVYNDYQGKGLVVLGFPSNEFGGQEPGTEAEIQTFCSTRFGVTFPMFSKVNVKPGSDQSPVFQFLSRSQPAPQWNFTKYLVGKDGKVIQSWNSRVAPESEEITKAIESALAAK